MSKKTKTIELVEDEKVINGVTVAELKLGEKSLGTVKPEDDKRAISESDGEKFSVKSHSEAVNILISHYHLHS